MLNCLEEENILNENRRRDNERYDELMNLIYKAEVLDGDYYDDEIKKLDENYLIDGRTISRIRVFLDLTRDIREKTNIGDDIERLRDGRYLSVEIDNSILLNGDKTRLHELRQRMLESCQKQESNNKYDELMREISESGDREKLNDGNEYDRRIQDIDADKLSGERNIERLQEWRKERFVMLNRLKEENILNENRRRDNERYDELMNLIYKAEILDGDYYDDEIKKLNENYLIDGRTIPRIRVFLDLARDIREKTNIGDDIERLRDGRYLSVEIDNSILLDGDKTRLHELRQRMLESCQKQESNNKYDELMREISESGDREKLNDGDEYDRRIQDIDADKLSGERNIEKLQEWRKERFVMLNRLKEENILNENRRRDNERYDELMNLIYKAEILDRDYYDNEIKKLDENYLIDGRTIPRIRVFFDLARDIREKTKDDIERLHDEGYLSVEIDNSILLNGDKMRLHELRQRMLESCQKQESNNKYDELMREISESEDREKLNDGNEYDRRIQDIDADKLSGERNIERLQEWRKERFVMLNRLKEENILNENRRRDNERYDELMNLIYKAEVLDGDYYDDEIKKLDENYLIDGRTIPRIRVFLDLTRDIREKTNIGDDIERLRDGRYLSVEIDNSILLDGDKTRLHELRQRMLESCQKQESNNKYDELMREISESGDREKLNDGNEYDRRIQDIDADKLSGERNIERLQERRKERFVMLNRLKEENILNENRRRDNERYDELMNLIYKAEILDRDYYDDEIKKLDENYLINGRMILRIRVFLDLARDIREKTKDDIERLHDGGYLSVEINNSILLNGDKTRLHELRQRLLESYQKQDANNKYDELMREILESGEKLNDYDQRIRSIDINKLSGERNVERLQDQIKNRIVILNQLEYENKIYDELMNSIYDETNLEVLGGDYYDNEIKKLKEIYLTSERMLPRILLFLGLVKEIRKKTDIRSDIERLSDRRYLSNSINVNIDLFNGDRARLHKLRHNLLGLCQNRLEKEELLNDRKHGNKRYDELMNLIYYETNLEVLNGDYYDDEIKKLNENYLDDGRTMQRICTFLSLEIG